MADRLKDVESEVVPFSEMRTIDLDTDQSDIEIITSYEPDDDMLEEMARRFEAQAWINRFSS